MILTWFEFILIGLAVFRLTHLFVYDTIMEPLRLKFLDEQKEIDEDGDIQWSYVVKGNRFSRFIGGILSCHWCLSVWFAGLILFGYLFLPGIFLVIIYLFAIAAIAAILEEIVIKYF